jgi:hypothetical protein
VPVQARGGVVLTEELSDLRFARGALLAAMMNGAIS